MNNLQPFTTKELAKQIKLMNPCTKTLEIMLKTWANQIVDLCAGNFECELVQMDIEQEEACYTLENGDQVYPVLIRSTVLDVKNQIK